MEKGKSIVVEATSNAVAVGGVSNELLISAGKCLGSAGGSIGASAHSLPSSSRGVNLKRQPHSQYKAADRHNVDSSVSEAIVDDGWTVQSGKGSARRYDRGMGYDQIRGIEGGGSRYAALEDLVAPRAHGQEIVQMISITGEGSTHGTGSNE